MLLRWRTSSLVLPIMQKIDSLLVVIHSFIHPSFHLDDCEVEEYFKYRGSIPVIALSICHSPLNKMGKSSGYGNVLGTSQAKKQSALQIIFSSVVCPMALLVSDDAPSVPVFTLCSYSYLFVDLSSTILI